MNTPWDKFAALGTSKQIGIIGSLTFAIVAIIAVIMWGTTPSYRVLYSNLSGEDSGAIMDQLSKSGINYKLNEASNSILVERDEVYKIRLDMSSLGLPKTSDNMDFFDSGQKMGLSKNMETARLKKMLEMELIKSINKIKSIRSSRIHIANPPNSVFSRERSPVTASVVVDVVDTVTTAQIKSIVSLVSASIPRLKKENVSVIDTRGSLLSSKTTKTGSEQLNKIENDLEASVLSIIGVAVGEANVSAKVNVLMEYIKKEKTSEIFSPKSGQLRSEEWTENITIDQNANKGDVPGALSNQPLKTDVTEKDKKETVQSENFKTKDGKFAKNYELNKTILHEINETPVIKRITVAVVINHRKEIDKDGKVTYQERTEEEMKEFKKIVENTIGFNRARGDSAVVISRRFEGQEDFSIKNNAEPESQWWENPIVFESGKWGSVLISILMIIFLVIRPLIAHIFKEDEPEDTGEDEDKGPSKGDLLKEGKKEFEDEMSEVRRIADEDPEIVAQVVKQWVSDDDE